MPEHYWIFSGKEKTKDKPHVSVICSFMVFHLLQTCNGTWYTLPVFINLLIPLYIPYTNAFVWNTLNSLQMSLKLSMHLLHPILCHQAAILCESQYLLYYTLYSTMNIDTSLNTARSPVCDRLPWSSSIVKKQNSKYFSIIVNLN